ncbi:MAG: NAD(P)/FAD-dependent oxidoreductase [Anaerolineae bacterium]
MSSSDLYDVIVVGAGLSGALIASTLAGEGLNVAVLEATRVPGGTVKRQPGLALLGTPEPFNELKSRQGEELAHTLWELTSENLVRLEILLDQAGIDSEKTGSLRLARDAEQSAAFRGSVAELSTYGYEIGLEDDSRYGDLVAISTADDLAFDPRALIQRLLDHENISLEVEAEVHAIKRRPEGDLAVWAHRRYLWARRVILANGIHGVRLTEALIGKVQAVCVHTVVFENAETINRPLILDDGHICFLPFGPHAYLTGWDETEIGILKRLSPIARQLCPDAAVHERFTTWIAQSHDRLPILGQDPGDPDVYLMNGLGPFGLNVALIAADELADLILEGQRSELFSLDRFE